MNGILAWNFPPGAGHQTLDLPTSSSEIALVALTYREDKATQAAAFLLARHGGRMNHMKLIKLLYLVDREALLRWGRPVTFDWYYSLQHGPILSFTLNRINEDPEPANPTYWHRFISERRVHEVELLRDAPVDELSPAEVALLNDVFERLGHLTQWDLRDLSHSLPEWRDPQGSRLPIEVGDILRAGRIPADQAQEILDALEAESAAERILQ